MYYTYIIRCEDNSLYTGITTEPKRRLEEHKNKTDKCAKYTLRHNALFMEALWQSENRIDASKLEYRIKRLNKIQKEELIRNNSNFDIYFENILECQNYERVKL